MYKKKLIAGVDEVGRGSLAGPVVAAAVIFKNSHMINGIRDSKKISFKSRNYLARLIKKNSYFGIGVASVKEIQKYNILGASLLSMTRALKKLSKKPGLILVDGNVVPKGLKNCRAIVKGDEKVKCISAASIIAKCFRDKLMIKMSKKFTKYRFEKNFGYGTHEHLKSLKRYGVTTIHRKKFRPIHHILFKNKKKS